jgi:hypothetical protein
MRKVTIGSGNLTRFIISPEIKSQSEGMFCLAFPLAITRVVF